MTASEPVGRESESGPTSGEPSPLDQLLDLVVYGPIGLALAARDALPQLAREGRRRLGPQLTAARYVGRMAVDQGTKQATDTLRKMAAGGPPRGGATDAGDASATDAPPPTAQTTGPGPTRDAQPTPTPAPAPAGDGEGLDPAELAIPGYDTLSASQVVQRLPGLSADELEAVRSYELAGRGRKTILLKVAQLKATPEP